MENNTPQENTHEITLYAEPVFHMGNFVVTNSMMTTWLVVVIVIILATVVKRKLKEVPRGIQNLFEMIMEGAMDLCDQVTGSRKLSKKLMPIALTVFFFVLLNNWIGLLPGVGTIGFNILEEGREVFVPLFRGGTADINTTLALSLLAVIGSNIFGIISVGAWKSFNKYVNLRVLGSMITKARKDPTVLIVAPVTFFVGIIEVLGEMAKVASLSFRLFGNIFAGEVLLASMSAIFAFVLPVPFLFLEVFVGLIQALIFALLTLVYFTIASQDHSEEH